MVLLLHGVEKRLLHVALAGLELRQDLLHVEHLAVKLVDLLLLRLHFLNELPALIITGFHIVARLVEKFALVLVLLTLRPIRTFLHRLVLS